MAARIALRNTFARASRPVFAARPIHTLPAKRHAEVINAAEVPVVSYHHGQRFEKEIPVTPRDNDTQTVNPPGADETHAAQALRPSVMKQLTPTMKKFTLEGKIAVVTGGGRGLGYNMTQALAEVGVEGIAILDVQQELGDQAARELAEQTGVDVRFYKVDVRDENAIQNAVADVVNHFGKIDVLISSAGIAE